MIKLLLLRWTKSLGLNFALECLERRFCLYLASEDYKTAMCNVHAILTLGGGWQYPSSVPLCVSMLTTRQRQIVGCNCMIGGLLLTILDYQPSHLWQLLLQSSCPCWPLSVSTYIHSLLTPTIREILPMLPTWTLPSSSKLFIHARPRPIAATRHPLLHAAANPSHTSLYVAVEVKRSGICWSGDAPRGWLLNSQEKDKRRGWSFLFGEGLATVWFWSWPSGRGKEERQLVFFISGVTDKKKKEKKSR